MAVRRQQLRNKMQRMATSRNEMNCGDSALN
jgi:hypothetical protein